MGGRPFSRLCVGILAALMAAATLAVVVPTTASAAPGDLDPTWGVGGRASEVLGAFSGGEIALAPDDKVVSVGIFTSTPTFVVTRWNTDGTIDTTFGSPADGGGRTGSRVLNLGGETTEAYAVVQDDLKVVVSGTVDIGDGQHRLKVTRLNADGTTDAGFGDGGVAEVSPTGWQIGDYPRGGQVALQSWLGGQRILVGATIRHFTTGYLQMGVAALTPTGAVDAGFAGGDNDGAAEGNFGQRSIVQDILVHPISNEILLTGHTGAEGGGEDAAIALLTQNGAIYGPGDGAFGSAGGRLRIDQAPGFDDDAAAVAFDPGTGKLAITGGALIEVTRGVVSLLNPNGTRDAGFGASGTYVSNELFDNEALDAVGADIAFAGSSRLIVGGTSGGRPAVARLDTSAGPDPHDPTFSSDGRALATCMSGAANGVAVHPDGKPLLGGQCGPNGELQNTVEVYRFQADDDGSGDTITVDAVNADTSEAAARRLGLPIDGVDREEFATRVASLQSAPLKNTPLKNTPLKNTPLKNTPLKNTPLKNTPLKNTSIPILLSDIPIEREGGWEAILVGTPYQGLPPHTVTIQQLLAVAPEPPALADLTLDEIDLAATPLKNTSITGTLLGLAPLSSLPAPGAVAGDVNAWCTYLAGQPYSCANGVTAATTITDLEVGGDDLADFYGQQIAADVLQDLPAGTPLLDVRLDDMSLVDLFEVEGITFAQSPSLFSCAASPCDPSLDLAAAQAADPSKVNPLATIADLFATRFQHGISHTLAQLIVALIPEDEFPYEDVPIAALFALVDEDTFPVTYTVDLTVTCRVDDQVTLAIDLPDGVEPNDETTSLFSGGDANLDHVSEGNDGQLFMSTFELCTGVPAIATYIFSATGDTALGVDDITVVGEVAVPVFDGEDIQYDVIDTDTRSGANVDSIDGTEPDASEPPSITEDVLYTGHVGATGDIDYFTVPAPPVGSTMTVYLSQLPADYDLVLYGPESADTVSTPLRNTPLKNTPLKNTPVEDDGLDPTGNILVPETLQDVPLKNTPLKNTSINRGTTTEVVSTTIAEGEPGEDLTIQVSGYDGATSAEPYMLRVRFDQPEADLPCITRSYTGTGTPAGTLPTVPAATQTLILVNRQRLGQVYGTSVAGRAAVTSALASLQTLANRTDVRGVVVPVEGDPDVAAAYADWDADPCSIKAANDVVVEINALVDQLRTSVTGLRHVVIVGSDEVVPQARLLDQVTLSNQRDYRHDAAFNGLDNPISRAFAHGYFLSDEPYGDFDPSPFVADALYLADVGLGRLVETPAEISTAIARFATNNGVLQLGSSFTAGYDFLKDGAQQVDAALRRPRGTTPATGPASRIDDTWTVSDIIAAWNHPSAPRAVSVNAHYDHYRALPAADSTAIPGRDLLFAGDLASSGIQPGALLFTMGCEAGLNIADVLVPLAPGGGPGVESQDWAQTTARKGGSFVGNTGYGYGDTDIVAYSEQVYAELARKLDGTSTVGQALSLAKHAVVSDIGIPGVYDAKALQEATFYGLPMFRVGTTGQIAGSFMPAPTPATPPTVTATAVDFDLDVTPTRQTRPEGDFWQVPGEPLVINHYRPVQPSSSSVITPVAGKTPHGVLITELTSTDIANVNPLEVRPTIDLGANEPKHDISEVLFPTTLSNVTHTRTATGRRDQLVLLNGQFFTDATPANGGVQRLFTHMGGQVLHSDDPLDFDSPTVDRVDAVTLGGSALFSVFTTPDAIRVFVLYREEGSGAWKPLDLVEGADGEWTGGAPLTAGGDEITEWFVQTYDQARNVGISTNKGRYFDGNPVPPTPAALTVTPPPSANGFYPNNTVVALEGATDDVAASVSIDGGDFVPSDGEETVSGNGLHTVVFRVGGQELTAVIPIDAAAPTATITYPAVGQVLTPTSSPTPVFSCSDGGSGVASCTPSPATLDLALGTHSLTVTAVDRVGNIGSSTRSYTVQDPVRIAFTSTRDGNVEIYSVRPDGTGATRLTNNSAIDADPVWSPNRQKLAFTSTRAGGGNIEIYVMNADGTGVTRLTNHAKVDTVGAWSPDGTKIAFMSTRDGNSEIYSMNANGTGLKRLTNHTALDSNPVWSPNGATIAFTSTRNGNPEIYTMNAATGATVTRLTNHNAADTVTSWSITGKLAFTSLRDGNAEIYSMNANGTGVTRLTNNARSDLTSSWSPDGTKLVFSSNRDGLLNIELYTMNANGTGVVRITNNGAIDTLPNW